jgi:hypothetical protein
MFYEWRGRPCLPVPENQLCDSARTFLLCGLSVILTAVIGIVDLNLCLLYRQRMCYSKIARRICITHSSLYFILVTRLRLPGVAL